MFKNTGEKYDAGKHFDLIKSIAKDLPKGKCANTIDDADLSGMKENDILLHFLKPDALLSLVEIPQRFALKLSAFTLLLFYFLKL